MTSRVARVLLLVLAGIILLATPVLAYLYRAPVAITENASTSYDMLPVLWDQNNTWLANNGFMNSTANDTRVQTLGGANKSHLVADNKTLTAIPVPADSQTNLYFTTGESEASAMDIITGDGGYVTITDDASLELGDNFTIEVDGWIDTSAGMVGENLVYKSTAFRTYVSASENITAAILEPDTNWVSPTAFNDPGSDWSDETNAYDDDTGTYASNTEASGGWSDWIELTCTAVTADRVRFYASGTSDQGIVSLQTEIEAYYSSSWNAVYNGNYTASTWAEKVLGGTYSVSEVRFKFRVTPGGSPSNDTNKLHEVDIGKVVDVETVSVTATGVSSGEHTVKTTADGTFLGIGVDQSNSDSWPISADLTLNAPMWHAGLNANPFTTKDTNGFTGTVTDAVWSSSSGYTFDGAGDYIDFGDQAELDFGDGASFTVEGWFKTADLGTYRTMISKGTGSTPTDPCWLARIGNTGKVYLEVGDAGHYHQEATDAVDFDDNAWHHFVLVKNGDTAILIYIDGSAEATSGAGDALNLVDDMSNASPVFMGRVDSGLPYYYTGSLAEIRVYNVALSTAQVVANYNATKWKFDGSASYPEYESVGAGVPDNANDWVLMSNATPYLNSYKHTVGGTLITRYEPNDIISGTTLPDREAASNEGTITWGSNPAGVGATVGSMSSSGQPDIGATSDTSTSDLLPVAGGTDWRPTPEVSVKLQANPMRPIVTAISDNTTLSEYQVWVWFGIIFVVFITVLTGANVRGHHLITGIAASGAVILMVVWTIFPLLVLLVVALAIGFGLVSERSPSL